MENRARELALLNLRIDRKLRGCSPGFPKSPQWSCNTRRSAPYSLNHCHHTRRASEVDQGSGLKSDSFLFPSRLHESPHLGPRAHARILPKALGRTGWLGPTDYGTHSMRRSSTGELEFSRCATATLPLQARVDRPPSRHRRNLTMSDGLTSSGGAREANCPPYINCWCAQTTYIAQE